MVFHGTAYGAREHLLPFRTLMTLYELINIYGITGLWYTILATLRWILWICSLICEWLTFMSVLYEAVIDNRLQRGESRSHDEGQQGQGWCFQLPSATTCTSALYLSSTHSQLSIKCCSPQEAPKSEINSFQHFHREQREICQQTHHWHMSVDRCGCEKCVVF